MTRILMVMPYRQMVRKARQEGLWVYSVWDPHLESPQYLREVEALSDAYHETDFADSDRLMEVVREGAERYAVSWIYHIGREESMLPVYRVAEAMGRSLNPSESIHLLNDKLALRQLLAANRLSPVKFATADRVADVEVAATEFGFPAVVKPTALAGSRGVYLLHQAHDLEPWRELIDRYRYRGPFLVEEYLKGPEFSVETLSCGGSHRVLGITAKQVGRQPLFIETGHLHPAPLATEQSAAIEQLVVRLLTLAGYRFGPAHTEVIWTVQGPRIVESQARLGGGRIPRLVELTTGQDIERQIFGMLVGRGLPSVAHRGSARLAYFEFPPGRIESIEGLDELGQLDFVDEVSFPFQAGDVLPVTVDAKSRHGYFIVTGRTSRQAEERAQRARKMVTVVTSPMPSATAQLMSIP